MDSENRDFSITNRFNIKLTMKKVLFYSVAFAAALASCTQDAIEDMAVNDNVQDLSIRPTLGEVVLTENADVKTRFAVSEEEGNDKAQAQFAVGDKLGAAIMDAPLYSNAAEYKQILESNNGDASKLYTLENVNYYSSNSAFTRAEGAWYLNKEDQPLVEGNYLFYAPYNATRSMRSAFEVRVPEVQNASTPKSALNEYYANTSNVVKVGYQFLAYKEGQAQRPSTVLNDLMAYPKFTIKNNFKGYLVNVGDGEQGVSQFEGTIKIDRVELYSTVDVVVGGQLDNKLVKTVFTEEWSTSPFENYTAQVLKEGSEVTVEANEKITTLNVGREIPKGEAIEIFAVVPAVKFEKNSLYAKVYATINEKPYLIATANVRDTDGNNSRTNFKANVTSEKSKEYMTKTEPVTLIKGQRYPQEELNFANGQLSNKSIAGNALTLDFVGGLGTNNGTVTVQVAKEQPVAGPGETPVETDLIDNNEEFINYFMNLENGSALAEDNTITDMNGKWNDVKFAFSESNTVEINSDLIEAFSNYNNKGTVSLTSSLPIADDVTISVDGSTVTFTSKNSVEYPVDLSTENYTISENAVISNGKSIHVIKSWTASESEVIGNVVVYEGAEATVNADVQFEAASFVNNGKLNASGTFINPVTNNGTINVGQNVYLVVDGGEGEVIVDSEIANAVKNNITVSEGQVGILTSTAIPSSKILTWTSVLDLNAETITLNGYAYGSDAEDLTLFEKVYLNATSITFSHDGTATFDMGENTTYYMNHESKMTIAGVNKSMTTVENFNIVNESTYQIELKALAGSGTPEVNGLFTNTDVKTAATWNGAAVGGDAAH